MSSSGEHLPSGRRCLAIGADAGGTKVAIRWTDGDHVSTHEAPSVNLRTSDPVRFARLLVDHITESLGGVSLDPSVQICIGAAGAGTPAIATTCQDEMARLLEIATDQITVTADAHIALRAAFPEGNGILLIAGTGSGCYSLDHDGALIRTGGWGPGLEDPGSGSELGRSAIKHLLACLESKDMDDLSRRVSEKMGLTHPSISSVLDTYYRADFHPSTLAPTILDLFDEGDSSAGAMIEEQCAALAHQCHRLSEARTGRQSHDIVVAGGLSKRPSYMQALSDAVTRLLPDVSVSRLQRQPVEGALSWALEKRASA